MTKSADSPAIVFPPFFIMLVVVVAMIPPQPCSAADSMGRCYVTVNVSPGPELPSGWRYVLSYRDTDNQWYFSTYDTWTGTHYKQAPNWLNKSITWRCQLQYNFADYGSPKEAVCAAGSSTVTFNVSVPSAPTITSQPTSQTVQLGASVTFSVSASGASPLAYQWRKNGINISGVTSASYTIASVTSNNGGEYTCYVSNVAGGVTSSAASLVVTSGGGDPPPAGGSVAIPTRPTTFPLARPNKKGRVVAWGNASLNPPDNLGLVVQVSAGRSHCLALRDDGTVVGWGINNYGETTIPPGLSNVVKVVAAGWFSLALKADGTVAAWGRNDYRQYTGPLDWNVGGVMSPWWHGGPPVPSLTDVVDVWSHPDSQSGAAILALKRNGTITMSGSAFEEQGAFPSGLTNIVQLGGGSRHNMVLRADGSALSWGASYGNDPWSPPSQVPLPSGLGPLAQVAACSTWSAALKTDGTVVSWGDLTYSGGTVPSGLSDVTQLAAGSGHMLALKRNGTVVAWGSNADGKASVPASLTNVIQVSAGAFNSLALVSVVDPTISIQKLGGSTLASGDVCDFGGQLVGEVTAETFIQVKNEGTENLELSAPVKTGTHATDFSLGEITSLTLQSGETAQFSVTFAPTAGGPRSAVVSISSNDPKTPNFNINLSGHGLADDFSTSGDGMSDAAKYRLRALGFDWQQSQPELVSALMENAQTAGLYTSNSIVANPSAFGLFTQTQYDSNRLAGRSDVTTDPANYGLYTSNSIMDLRMGGMIVQKQGDSAVVIFQPQTTTDLVLPFTNNGTPITNHIPMPGNKGFIRIQANPDLTPVPPQ